MELHRYMGQTIEIIYMDRAGCLTQRKITVTEVRERHVRAYCHTRKGPRLFNADNVLAAFPIAVRRLVLPG